MRRLPLALAWTVLVVLLVPGRALARPPAVPDLPALHAVYDTVHGGRVVDAQGRQVVLRGVNDNALGEYWQGTSLPTTFPLEPGDPQLMRVLGFNVVRLVLSWSRVEPASGHYDEGYLAYASSIVNRLAAMGIYTVLDMHQDAWGATLAARPGEACSAPALPALGWDGAPGWATLVPDDVPRCFTFTRERNPAVIQAWQAFFNDDQGLQEAFSAMWRHVAEHFARMRAVAGYDILNEPNAFEGQGPDLARMYSRALVAIRAGEQAAGGFSHLVFFEPSVLDSGGPNQGVPPRFTSDPNMVWSPHIYQGAFNNGPITSSGFTSALTTARRLGGLPVVIGEWGTDAVRAQQPYDYFLAHEALQDRFGVGATMWQFRQSCGDPHKAPGVLTDAASVVLKGLFDVDCTDNRVIAPRLKLLADLQRGYVRAAPGRLGGEIWNPAARRLGAVGTARGGGPTLLAFYPLPARVRTSGLTAVRVLSGPSGTSYIEARPRGGPWRLAVSPATATGAGATSPAERQRAVLLRAARDAQATASRSRAPARRR